MSKVTVFDHPFIQYKLTCIRDQSADTNTFRKAVDEISTLMTYELLRDLPVQEVTVHTPLAPTAGIVIAENTITVVPILRAGLGMVDGVLRILPGARVGHIGMYRDERTLQPVEYYWNVPKHGNEQEVIIVDPMLATGGSAVAAINLLKKEGAQRIKWMSLIAAPEGIAFVHEQHGDVPIYAAAVDERLNAKGYILPGLGDAGDRMYGTS